MRRNSSYLGIAAFIIALIAVPLLVYSAVNHQTADSHASFLSGKYSVFVSPRVVSPGGEADVIWMMAMFDPTATIGLFSTNSTAPVFQKTISSCSTVHADSQRHIGVCPVIMPQTQGTYVVKLFASSPSQPAQVVATSNPVSVGSPTHSFPSIIPTGIAHRGPSIFPHPSGEPIRPISITPRLTCIPRPACLDSTPHCMLAEPVGGWCPAPSSSPVTTNK